MLLISTLKFIVSHPLNQSNKIGAVARFVKWQIGSRLMPGDMVYPWINGAKFLVRRGETGLTGNIYAGLHEFVDMAFLLHYIRPDDLFVDIGANVGSYTVLACAAAGASGVAFEPVPQTYRRLVENIRINNIQDRVEFVNKGVGDKKGSVAFSSDLDTTNHALAPDEQRNSAIPVDLVILDDFLGDKKPDMLKIDVEGYETLVLRGAGRILSDKQLNAVIMELNGSGGRYGFDELEILSLMLEYGFKTYSYDPFKRTLVNLKGKNLKEGNTLFLRNVPLVQDRIHNAQSITINGVSF